MEDQLKAPSLCKRILSACILVLIAVSFCAAGEQGTPLPPPGKELSSECLACFLESFQLLKEFGDNIWKGFGGISPRVNIITPHYEFFFGDQAAPQGYQLFSGDRCAGKPIYYKKRDFPQEFTLTVNRIEGKPALYISSKEIFEKTYLKSPLYKIAEDYLFTILQQYFHLFLAAGSLEGKVPDSQFDPQAFRKIYPYLDFTNSRLMEIEGDELRQAYLARDAAAAREHLVNFFKIRALRQKELHEDTGTDFCLFENWSEWYEGLAKYTEVEFARALSLAPYKPLPSMRKVKNFRDYRFVRNKTSFELSRLKSTRTSLVHAATGFTEALLLDRQEIKWKEKILEPGVFPADLLKQALKKQKDYYE
ncbi:MAG: hypothetical protein RDV48_06515 [Candidatus Eremiobacteraeota bacterium]|nr:hypothetical protein [Candidatus Eremiobacteraeota bacterium]